jgi:hypothetical protein
MQRGPQRSDGHAFNGRYEVIDDPEEFEEIAPWDESAHAEPAAVPMAEPTIDPRALATPHAVAIPLVSRKDDRRWTNSEEADLRERSFRVYYDGPYASVSDPTLRFASAIISSCRPILNPALIPDPTRRRKRKRREGVIVQRAASAESVEARAEAPRRTDADSEESPIAFMK